MSRKKANIHYIYKTTCNVTGRWYVGMHSTSNENDGYLGSGKILRHSIRKYGVENHTKEILEFLPTREELVLRETEIVNKELISDGKCMNLKEGGTGGFNSETAKKGRLAVDKILFEKYGTDFKRIIGLSYYNLNEKEKEIFKNKIKDGQKKIKYDNNTFGGKSHSEETKQLMSEIRKGTGTGETNSQYGTCWVTKDGSNKKIKKEDLETYLNEGWCKGRK